MNRKEKTMLSQERINALKKFAIEVKKTTLMEIATLGIGHVGGSMSICELIACLYGEILNIDPKNPGWKERDRFVMSKGHAGPTMYAALALKGYFPMDELTTLNRPGTNLPSHTDHNKTLGVDMTTGSLGQGISSAVGIALACKLDRIDNYTYCLIGDGECQEGQVWEALAFAAQYKLNRFIVFVDKNAKQLDGPTEMCMDLGDLKMKFVDFGFNSIELLDGHDVEAICNAVEDAKKQKSKPSVIILNTIKAKDCPAAKRVPNDHNMPLNMADYEEACRMLDEQIAY